MFVRALPLCLLALLAIAVRATETSPLTTSPSDFVRAQATSGVKWHLWNAASLVQARQQSKSVYVFIGSPLSELTRATINQTFTSEKTVAWLNENFFCLFVDADTQPDVAALGQHFINSVKQLRGQPVHLWLTPDTLQPYDGANYLPPSEEWGKPGFLKAARGALDTWTIDPARARALATEALDMMRLPPVDTSAPLDIEAKLAAATKAWVAAADPVNGGFGTAPKLPEPELIRFLLARQDWGAKGAGLQASMALVSGALRDPVDGGFYRRCIDEAWKEPYYQKTLADQARIALALQDASQQAVRFLASSSNIPRELIVDYKQLSEAAIGALDFALKELRNADGTFAAALDGTLEENADLARRPKFTKVGTAKLAAQALLILAMQRSGEPRLMAEAKNTAASLYQDIMRPIGTKRLVVGDTAADQATMALLLREMGDSASADLFLQEIRQKYFDKTVGSFMAAPKDIPIGITARVPTSGETPSAEVLALLAGVDAKTADLIRRNLMQQIEYDELPPGDILLGLSQGQK